MRKTKIHTQRKEKNLKEEGKIIGTLPRAASTTSEGLCQGVDEGNRLS
jgi:beta-lactam-binding protein with PASTA domain